MKNLNKFTKDELIKQYKNLEKQNSNQTLILKIINTLLYFKGLIIKITLIGLIIKWIKKYSLVKKLWHIFSIIGNALLGFTLIDIYSWDIISWIKDTSIYKWYIELFKSYKTDKIETIENPSKFPKVMIERTSIETNGNENGIQKSDEISHRFNRWFNKQEIDKQEVLTNEEFNKFDENNYNANYKYYFILGTLIITTGIVWYYWNDIRPGDAANTVIEKVRSFRSWFNNDENNIIDNNPRNITVNIPTNVNPPIEDIQLSNTTQPPNYESIEINKGKAVLTSPSLENLNEQAESSWNTGVSSPGSDDSSVTITPESSSSSSSTFTSTSTSNSSSSSINTISTVSNFIKNNWRKRFTDEVNDKINFIESSLMNENKLEGLKLADYYAFIINEYNKEIEVYNYIKTDSNHNIQDLNVMRQSFYHFREWIAEYQPKILPDSTVSIEIGSLSDSPKLLSKNIV